MAFRIRTSHLSHGAARLAASNRSAIVEPLEQRCLFSAGLPTIATTLAVSHSTVHALSAAIAAAVNSVSVDWGTSGSSTLVTQADGLRLLPPGRSTDMPWLGIDQIGITLSSPATLSPGDVTVNGISVANYGPVSISGSGTNYTITLSQPINKADRVTITIGNAGISTYTRRLDVLPGDVNDDGVVNAQDAVLVRNGMSSPYNVFDDINGDGAVNINDYSDVARLLGTKLPTLALV
jgi:hypothetical protein